MSLQGECRNLQKAAKQQPSGAPSSARGTSRGASAGRKPDAFKHSFKRSFNTSSLRRTDSLGLGADGRSADWMPEQLEQNLKKFNDRFMETLTESLTQQLGFDITEAAANKRRNTVGQSFIDKDTSSGSFLGLKFGADPPKDGSPGAAPEKAAASPFGRVGAFGRAATMSASVVVPGLRAGRKRQSDQGNDAASPGSQAGFDGPR